MILDILIGLTLLGFAVYGFHKGFVFTLIHTVGWVGAVVLAYLAVPFVETFLKDNTGLYKWLYSFLQEHFDASLSTVDAAMKTAPAAIAPSLSNYSTNIVDGVTSSFATVIFTILVFAGLFVIIKLVLWLLLRLVSKDYKSGFTNFFDGLLGTVFGLLKGGILVIIALALVMPLSSMIPPDFAGTFFKQLNSSIIAQEVYNNNFLLIILQAFNK